MNGIRASCPQKSLPSQGRGPLGAGGRIPSVAGRGQGPAPRRRGAVPIVRGILLLLADVGVSGPAPGGARGRCRGAVGSAPGGRGIAPPHSSAVAAYHVPLGDPPLGARGAGPRSAAVTTSRLPPSIVHREVPLGVEAVPIGGRTRAFTRGLPRPLQAQDSGCSSPASSAPPRTPRPMWQRL